VEVLDVVVDRGGELDAGLPALAVEELDLHASPERFDHRIVTRCADGAHRGREAGVSNLLAERPGGELPRSEWITSPSRCWRRCVAMPSALSTSLVACVLSIDQPTTKRENASSTTAQ
jgi:hypothetical protein